MVYGTAKPTYNIHHAAHCVIVQTTIKYERCKDVEKNISIAIIIMAIIGLCMAQQAPSYTNCKILEILNGTTGGNAITFVSVNNGKYN